jgi:methyltransferase family protein
VLATRNIPAVAGRVGSDGRGDPSLESLVRRVLRLLARSLVYGNSALTRFYLRAATWNLWQFTYGRARGRKVRCPFCDWTGPAFIALADAFSVAYDSTCPRCDSRSRHRGLLQVLPDVLGATPPGDVLVFAPERILLDVLRGGSRRVLTTDLNLSDVDFPHEDIQRLSLSSGSFAALVCNHVLEHVSDDDRALSECSRILRSGGAAVFTIPGDYDAEETRVFPGPDLNGEYRRYGRDVVAKMRSHFASVEAIDMHVMAPADTAVRTGDHAFVCRK